MPNVIMDIELTDKGFEFILKEGRYNLDKYLQEVGGRQYLIEHGYIRNVPENILKEAWLY